MKAKSHAEVRAQQRGVSPLVVDLLFQFGVREHDARGAEVIYFDKRARKRLAAYTGGLLGKLSEQLDAYAVVEGNQLVTVGPRYKRVNHV